MSASLEKVGPRPKRKRIALILAALLPVIAAAVYLFGLFLDFEYVHWPTIWQASRAKTPTGVRVAELIRDRVASSEVTLRWHHCGWCNTVYTHANHVAIKVTLSANEGFLFDWDPSTRRLLPITIGTAERFPELIPSGFIIEPLTVGGLDGQLHIDRACRIVAGVKEI
jgi:hypothetical protein